MSKSKKKLLILPRILLIIILSTACIYLLFILNIEKDINQVIINEVQPEQTEDSPLQQPIEEPKRKIETLDQVPYLSQLPEYPNGCEATSATMVLQYYQHNIRVYQMMDYIPITPIEQVNNRTYGGNPENTFAGSMIKIGYGIYAPALTKAINDYLIEVDSPLKATNISGASKDKIIELLESGTPIIMWLTDNFQTIHSSSVHTWYLKENGKYTNQKITFPLNEHCVVLTHYKNGEFTIHDPLQGVIKKDVDQIMNVYNSFNQMAVILEPK